ncbi:serine dehydratase subunit alpha family protein [Clostridium transplantifaecale]|uniref:L-cysteine desulfidase family protein n=1 Tax=Clostridium transplantifaecale TaxID=2479838 RepID=UPI000F6449DF|nr:L-serine ammonia-lyase, iron-sulfur-dependent, subunit alpha [Clostridium transplantifaecale]
MDQEAIIGLIQSEMKPGMGCTEPAAIGLAVSNTCGRLDSPAAAIHLKLSSNIFKNAFCVKIPNTDKAGIPLAAALGALLAGQDNTMEIFSQVTAELTEEAERMLKKGVITLEVEPDNRFYIEVTAREGQKTVRTITMDRHDNLVYIEKDGKILMDRREELNVDSCGGELWITESSVCDLVDICEKIPVEKITFLKEGIEMNRLAAQMGLSRDYGLNIGKKIRSMVRKGAVPDDLASYVKMNVSAACDCRMGGAPISAMTVLGSGNQGFESILLPASAAEYLGCDEEKMLRSVMISILLTIRIKYHVGRLSPICGATLSGAAGAGAVVWLMGGNREQIDGAMQNMLGSVSGMLCDGAKDGCALKLGNCAGEAVLAACLAMEGSIIRQTDGIISRRVEDTIRDVARLSREGMAGVDMNIISIMLSKENVSGRPAKVS